MKGKEEGHFGRKRAADIAIGNNWFSYSLQDVWHAERVTNKMFKLKKKKVLAQRHLAVKYRNACKIPFSCPQTQNAKFSSLIRQNVRRVLNSERPLKLKKKKRL